MGSRSKDGSEARFTAYVDGLVSVIGHADRAKPLRDYCVGLMLPGERKSVERDGGDHVAGAHSTAAQHQSLLHFVGTGGWSDEKVLAKVREMVQPKIERHGPIEAWIIDDSGFPKKGRHSVGVARQHCGQLGKQDNCQVAVSLSIANHHASLPIAYRLYLPQSWAEEAERREKTGVPKDVVIKTKPEIALEQIRSACEADIERGVVLMNAGYGADTTLRKEVTALELSYVAGILPNTSVWPPGMGSLPPKKWSGNGRPTKLMRRDDKRKPARTLGLPKQAWRNVKWREGSADFLTSRFARPRVRPGHRDYWLSERHAEERLLIERPDDESEPTIYCGQADLLLELLAVAFDAPSEPGQNDQGAEGATLCIAAYGFRISERERRFPPHDLVGPRSSKKLRFPKSKAPPRSRLEPSAACRIRSLPRRRLASILVRWLRRCPCCAIQIEAHAPS